MSTPQTIVSLLPVPLSRDTRSLKIAKSFACAGFRSIVFETRPSPSEWTAQVELQSLGGRRFKNAAPEVAAQRPTKGHFTWAVERIHFLRFVFLYWFWMPLRLLFSVPKADLYYVHEYRLFPAAMLLGKRHQARLVYDAHDFYPAVWDKERLSDFWRSRFLPFLTWMDGFSAKRADLMITVGDGVAQCIEHAFGIRPEVIRNIHDPSLDAEAPELRQTLGLKADDILIVCIGNAKTGYDAGLLLKAMEGLGPKVHIAFVGRFHEQKTPHIRELNLQNVVHLPGAVEPGQVVPFVRSADIAALPYTPDTLNTLHILPNGFFQSIAAGLALLYPKLPDIESIIGDCEVGLAVDWTDPTSIDQQLHAMVGDEERREQCRRNAVKLAETVSWQAEEKRLLYLIEQMLERTH